MTDSDDEMAELVAAARDGDRAGLRRAGRATYAEMYTLAYRLTGNEEDARDVVQEAYLRAYKGLQRSAATPGSPRGCTGSPPTAPSTISAKRTRHRHEELDDDRRRSTAGPTATPRTPAACARDRLHRALARAAPPAAGRRRAARHLRPAPRGHRRRAGHLRGGGQGPPAPGPPPAPRDLFPCVHRRGRGREEACPCGLTSCADAAGRASPTATVAADRRRPRATWRRACAARPSSVQYRSCCGPCAPADRRARARRPACSPSILAALDGGRRAAGIRSALPAAGPPTSAAWPPPPPPARPAPRARRPVRRRLPLAG